MAKVTHDPLAFLNLKGLSQLEDISQVKDTKKAGFKAASKPQALAENAGPTLGPLKDLPGTWVGTGFNLIELPNRNQIKPGPPPTDKFRVELNSTSETLTFSAIVGGIFNRGNAQDDIEYLGIHYLQQVSDVNLPQGQNGIHLETGLFLNLPAGTNPAVQPSVARLGSIPHGDSLLAQGRFFEVAGGPQFNVPPADPTPFTIVNGKRTNDDKPNYLALLTNAVPPPGIPKEVIMNPNILLENAIKGQKIINTIVILLDANPIDGVCNPGAINPTGGITNIPFIEGNANATSLSAIFWIETVQNADGSTFQQLQYTQTVILEFPVFGADPQSPPIQINWPHTSVATLRKMNI